MGAIVLLKFPSERVRTPAVRSPVSSGAVVSMVRENVKRKPAGGRAKKKRERYVPAWQPLSAKWESLKHERGYAQKALAVQAKSSEGAVSQYLNGTTPLTIEWALQFALYMNVPITEIWPDFPFAKLVPGGLTPDEVEIALRFRASSQKQAVSNLLRDLK